MDLSIFFSSLRIVSNLVWQEILKKIAFIFHLNSLFSNSFILFPIFLFSIITTYKGRKDELAQQIGKLIGKAITVTDIKWQ